jgi:hypothetical protein
MNETRRTHLEAIPPVPAILGAIVSVQAGAALAKGLFPALGPIGTVGLRVVLSAMMLLAAFRPKLRGTTAAQWRAVIPYGLVLGTMTEGRRMREELRTCQEAAFDLFTIVTKIAVNSSHSARNGASLSASTIPESTSNSSQYALSSASRRESPHFATNSALLRARNASR